MSHYLNPLENFDSTLARAKDYILVDEALNLLEGEDRDPPKEDLHTNESQHERPPLLYPDATCYSLAPALTY